jgi:hypothetical protein
VLARFAGALLAFLGVCWLVGWFQNFRERFYLLFLGLAFLMLGVDVLLPREFAVVKQVLLGLSTLSTLAAIVLAVLETRSRLAELAQRRRAMEAEMQAYIEKLKKDAQEKTE